MDFFEAQEFFKSQYPGKQVSYEFDDNCHRQLEIIHTDGKPHMVHHVECRKVKVNVEGQASFYAPISPHRMNTTWAAAKAYVNSKSDVHIAKEDLVELANLKAEKPEEYQSKLSMMSEYSGLSKSSIESKML